MRILHLWDVYSPGLFDQSHAMCLANGHDSALLAMHLLEKAQPPEANVTWVRRIDEAVADGLFERLSRKLRRILDRQAFRHAVARSVATHRPDVVHFHFGTTAAGLDGVAGLFEVPYVVSFYGFDISAGLEDRRLSDSYRRLLPGAGKVHVLCEEARARALTLGARLERTGIVNLPVDTELYPLIPGPPGPIRNWLIPARFVAKKGHEVLLDAFRTHLAVFPEHRLTCWGYGPDRWLRDLIDARGLVDAVSVVQSSDPRGFDIAYREQLASHHVVLAPSVRAPSGDDEGGPALTAVLAQLAGKPVIYSDFPGHECSLTEGVEGLVVPQGDAGALAQAMASLCANSATAKVMGLAGRRRVLADFSPHAYWIAIKGWYQDLTG